MTGSWRPRRNIGGNKERSGCAQKAFDTEKELEITLHSYKMIMTVSLTTLVTHYDPDVKTHASRSEPTFLAFKIICRGLFLSKGKSTKQQQEQ